MAQKFWLGIRSIFLLLVDIDQFELRWSPEAPGMLMITLAWIGLDDLLLRVVAEICESSSSLAYLDRAWNKALFFSHLHCTAL
jgi:hypothetical protein